MPISIPSTNRTCFSCGRAFPSWGERKCPICRKPKQRAMRDARVGRRLTFRERQIAELIAQAKGDKEIAYALGLSPGTVKQYMNHMFSTLAGKLLDRNRVAVAVWWVTEGREQYVQTSANPSEVA
jgi:DNA-binding NarL/FixJ family response regulator